MKLIDKGFQKEKQCCETGQQTRVAKFHVDFFVDLIFVVGVCCRTVFSFVFTSLLSDGIET